MENDFFTPRERVRKLIARHKERSAAGHLGFTPPWSSIGATVHN